MDDSTESKDVWVDAVSHLPIDPDKAKHRSFYAGKMYHFEDLTNKQTFDQDPQLWVSTPHVSETSANVDPLEER